jgi:hypothetical protein
MSLARILADPQAVHGRAVKVGGYLHLEFEDHDFCLHKDDADYLVITNCVWLQVPDREDLQVFSDRYVAVEGIVNASGRGHLGVYQAEIDKVSRITVQPERAAAAEHYRSGSH